MSRDLVITLPNCSFSRDRAVEMSVHRDNCDTDIIIYDLYLKTKSLNLCYHKCRLQNHLKLHNDFEQ